VIWFYAGVATLAAYELIALFSRFREKRDYTHTQLLDALRRLTNA
jgi:hypothetical protein